MQIAILSVLLFPLTGAKHSPYDSEAQQLANLLKAEQVESVWLSPTKLSNMYLDVVLTQNDIFLPNVYYGDMGQQTRVDGPYCGYSFDSLIIPSDDNSETKIKLTSAISKKRLGWISLDILQRIGHVRFDTVPYDIYRVVCNEQ